MAFNDAQHATLEGPAARAAAVTPDDDVDLTEPSRALYVGQAGNVAVEMLAGGAPVTFEAVPAGLLLPIRVRKVLETGTTAGQIISIF